MLCPECGKRMHALRRERENLGGSFVETTYFRCSGCPAYWRRVYDSCDRDSQLSPVDAPEAQGPGTGNLKRTQEVRRRR